MPAKQRPTRSVLRHHNDVVYNSFQERPKPSFKLDIAHRALRVLSVMTAVVAPVYFVVHIGGLDTELPMHFNQRGEVTRQGSAWEAFWTLLLMSVMTIGLAVLSKYPRIFNYPVALTEANVQRQYRNAAQMMVWMTFSLAVILLVMVINWLATVGMGLMWAPMVLMFAVMVYFIWRMFKLR